MAPPLDRTVQRIRCELQHCARGGQSKGSLRGATPLAFIAAFPDEKAAGGLPPRDRRATTPAPSRNKNKSQPRSFDEGVPEMTWKSVVQVLDTEDAKGLATVADGQGPLSAAREQGGVGAPGPPRARRDKPRGATCRCKGPRTPFIKAAPHKGAAEMPKTNTTRKENRPLFSARAVWKQRPRRTTRPRQG